jgi:hypothetical protein
MSAYIVDENHISYIVAAALSNRIRTSSHGRFTWWHNHTREISQYNPEGAAEFATELWQENVKSVNHRYPNDPAPLALFTITPQKLDEMLHAWDFEPIQLLKAISCLDYQSCEHPEWETSNAHAFLEGLKNAAIASLAGYSDAAWGSPKTSRQIRMEHFATA